MRNNSLRIHPSALGGFTIEGPYKRKPARRALRARIALLLAVLVAGCGKASAEKPEIITGQTAGHFEYIVTDHETGCQYIEVGNSGFYPRLDAAGKPMCGKGA